MFAVIVHDQHQKLQQQLGCEKRSNSRTASDCSTSGCSSSGGGVTVMLVVVVEEVVVVLATDIYQRKSDSIT